MTLTNATPARSIETENPLSTESAPRPKGGARPGAGALPLPPEQKMVAYKIAARPDDWQFLGLFVDQTAAPEERTPGHLFRAAIAHLRLFAPNGPDKPFYTPDPDAPRATATTPAIAREAKRRGQTKAEFLNEIYAGWKATQGSDK